MKRAIIVSEPTGGGAHPGGTRRLSEHFASFIPSGRAIDPIPKINWGGTGVEPDVAVPADRALDTAHLAAVEALLKAETTKDKPDDPMRVELLRNEIERLKKGTPFRGDQAP